MFFTRSLCVSVLATAFLLSPAAMASPPPVFGYLAEGQSCALTIDGQEKLVLDRIPQEIQPPVKADLEKMARRLNRIVHEEDFNPNKIVPVLANKQYEIRYQDQLLLRLKPFWARYYSHSRLSSLLKLTNQMRRHLGTAPLSSFASINSSIADQVGLASWYGGHFHGRLTANGERYDVHQLTAAHKHLPFGTKVLVTNMDTHRSVVVKINDRGPFKPQRIIDLSPAAFEKIGYLGQGVLRVKLTVLS